MAEWLDREDREFIESNCNFKGYFNPKEFSQCSVVGVETKEKPFAFFKKACVALLQIKSPRNNDEKWRVTQQSFINEHTFLKQREICELLIQNRIHVPRLIALGTSSENINDFSTIFRTMTEFLDIGGLCVERKTMDASTEATRVMTYLARFHAFFSDEYRLSSLKSMYFDNGGWWRKKLRPTVKWDMLPVTFNQLYKTFPEEFSRFDLEQCSKELSNLTILAKSDAFLKALRESSPISTLIHGDVKTSNFFLLLDGKADDVVAIDFQWVGGAVSGAADVVYFIFGGVTSFPSKSETMDEFLIRMRETEDYLKTHYLTEFVKANPETKLTHALFELHYDLELLEYFTTAVPYLLGDLTPKLMKKNFDKYGYLTYEFDSRMLYYFFARAFEVFQTRKESLT